MCLKISKESIEKTEKLKAQGKPIIAYKILKPDMKSQFEGFQWQMGTYKSDRESTELTELETESLEVDRGFHFFTEKPKDCPYRCRDQSLCRYLYLYRCPYQYLNQRLYLNQYLYLCLLDNPINKVYKVKIQPQDLVAIGIWDNLESIAATKCELIEEVGE